MPRNVKSATSKKHFSLFRWLTKHFVIIMSLFKKYIPEFICLSLFLIFGLWMFGYLMNGLYGTSFPLESGISAIGAISSAGVMSLVKYFTDSKLNSELGVKPTKALHEKIDRYIAGEDFIDLNNNGIDDRKEGIDYSKK